MPSTESLGKNREEMKKCLQVAAQTRLAALRVSSSKKAFNYCCVLLLDNISISPAVLPAGCRRDGSGSQVPASPSSARLRGRAWPFPQSLLVTGYGAEALKKPFGLVAALQGSLLPSKPASPDAQPQEQRMTWCWDPPCTTQPRGSRTCEIPNGDI